MGNTKSQTSKKKQSDVLPLPKEELVEKYNRRFNVNKDSILNGDKLANWLTDVLQEEQYNDLNTIQEDLQNPYGSHIKQRMDADFQEMKLNEHSVDEVYTFLRDDMFNDEYINTYDDSTYNLTGRGA
eukprot:54030_1